MAEGRTRNFLVRLRISNPDFWFAKYSSFYVVFSELIIYVVGVTRKRGGRMSEDKFCLRWVGT